MHEARVTVFRTRGDHAPIEVFADITDADRLVELLARFGVLAHVAVGRVVWTVDEVADDAE